MAVVAIAALPADGNGVGRCGLGGPTAGRDGAGGSGSGALIAGADGARVGIVGGFTGASDDGSGRDAIGWLICGATGEGGGLGCRLTAGGAGMDGDLIGALTAGGEDSLAAGGSFVENSGCDVGSRLGVATGAGGVSDRAIAIKSRGRNRSFGGGGVAGAGMTTCTTGGAGAVDGGDVAGDTAIGTAGGGCAGAAACASTGCEGASRAVLAGTRSSGAATTTRDSMEGGALVDTDVSIGAGDGGVGSRSGFGGTKRASVRGVSTTGFDSPASAARLRSMTSLAVLSATATSSRARSRRIAAIPSETPSSSASVIPIVYASIISSIREMTSERSSYRGDKVISCIRGRGSKERSRRICAGSKLLINRHITRRTHDSDCAIDVMADRGTQCT
jgi:hypothetical protein